MPGRARQRQREPEGPLSRTPRESASFDIHPLEIAKNLLILPKVLNFMPFVSSMVNSVANSRFMRGR